MFLMILVIMTILAIFKKNLENIFAGRKFPPEKSVGLVQLDKKADYPVKNFFTCAFLRL